MWMFGTVENRSPDPVWIAHHIDPGTTVTAPELGTGLGRAEIGIGHHGTMYLRSANTPDGADATVTIEGSFGTVRWTAPSPATLDVLVHEDSSFALSDRGSEIVSGVLRNPTELGQASAAELGNLPPTD
ncbi:hypothetical protein [Streptomyces syringium]|uniref:Uncharacterized protein n=1 Tax=Streptomyces syringium TaxID=76729 RepID=A0ABS4XX26_9ACTN|nr:hypothetical protein [Streptomyces syringium]MBP2400812.1 hypothetical protein [Streptomyces syringium]